MYLSPSFEYHVLKFVADKMIEFRKEAGDGYKELSSAIAKIVSKEAMVESMKKVAIALNFIVFGKHESSIRNDFGTEEKQKELRDLQKKVATLINEDFIKDFDSLVVYLRKQYVSKHTPQIFETKLIKQ